MHKSEAIDIFCANIAYLRKIHRLSKREMCRKLHIGFKTLQMIEQGTVPPGLSSEIVIYAAESFGLSPSALFRHLP